MSIDVVAAAAAACLILGAFLQLHLSLVWYSPSSSFLLFISSSSSSSCFCFVLFVCLFVCFRGEGLGRGGGVWWVGGSSPSRCFLHIPEEENG